ncbi:hypothetical protein HDU91_001989, partial [Kappamyces sp. JEL0680]
MYCALLLAVHALASQPCVGTCDSPSPVTFDGRSPSEYMMYAMTRDIEKLRQARSGSERNTDVVGRRTACENGFAGEYPCSNLDLLSHLSHATMGSPGKEGNDIWGWTDPTTGREYAIVGQVDGTAFVDITDPVNPVVKGRLPTHTESSSWRDIKVYKDHAFIVSEATNHGVQVFDLTLLRGSTAQQTFSESAYYKETGRCHNFVINEATGLGICV